MHDFAPSVAVASSDSAADGTATDGSANPDTSTTDPANPGTSTKGDHTKQNPWDIFDPYSEQNAPTAISLNATSASERDGLLSAGWRYEGIGWYGI